MWASITPDAELMLYELAKVRLGKKSPQIRPAISEELKATEYVISPKQGGIEITLTGLRYLMRVESRNHN